MNLNLFKKIAAFSFLVIYVVTIGLSYSVQFQSTFQKTKDAQWYAFDDLKDHFKHTIPSKLALGVQIKPSPQPYPAEQSELWAQLNSYSFYFDSLFNLLSSGALNLLIEQKKIDLLYSFHSFP
ncbi:MAG: hypothetical protein ABJN36_02690 [Cyclobacteriaceae bacterium]